ncbi:MAG TPA: hypothetical protein VIM31_02010 [Candidatus Microsaccharimonas sp.]|jgi:hypothetical protein
MQSPTTQKRIENWSTAKVVSVIGLLLLLGVASYMAYVAIDTQAMQSSLKSSLVR